MEAVGYMEDGERRKKQEGQENRGTVYESRMQLNSFGVIGKVRRFIRVCLKCAEERKTKMQ